MSTSSFRDATSVSAEYLTNIVELLQRVQSDEQHNIQAAARVLADCVQDDRLIHVYGPGGHSNIAAQEVFFRAGGLANISAILDPGTLLSNGAQRAAAVERVVGYGASVIRTTQISKGDVLILVSAYGINAVLIDAALEAKRQGIFLIGVSSVVFAQSTPEDHPSRHPTKKNLHELVDIAIDSKVPVGDSVVKMEGVRQLVGPTSSFANIFILNCVVLEAVSELSLRGIDAPIWTSVNIAGGDEANASLIQSFRSRIRNL